MRNVSSGSAGATLHPMVGESVELEALDGIEAALVGRLASMTHAEAAGLLRAAGGRVVDRVRPETRWVVIGEGGPPLGTDGRVTQRLEQALALRAQGHEIEILIEGEFLRRIGLFDGDPGESLFPVDRLARLVGVSVAEIRRYVRLGLVRPRVSAHGVHRFSFREVAWTRRLVGLLRDGASPALLRRSLERLRGLLRDADVDRAHALLERIERSDLVIVRLPDGRPAEPNGQLLFDFDGPPHGARVLPHPRASRREAFDRALEAELAGRLEEAAALYDGILREDPRHVRAAEHLGAVLLDLDRPADAIAPLRTAAHLEPDDAERWTDLGEALLRAGLAKEAVEALGRALAVDPDHSEAHFLLGEAFGALGDLDRACHHWLRYAERNGEPDPGDPRTV